ncbi:MAG: hypothetical protein O3B09_03815 [Proteobacteria bacterium]|nr:hypothetical protein [Pseudomonadota bacterium]
MTKSETKLLSKLLKNGGYCINSEGDLSFSIISKQEKIYDATFASLIDENYNAKSVTPVTYFGECN